MYYEINVSKDGKHFFATHERSCTSLEHVARVYEELCLRFLPEDGYFITVTRWVNQGQQVTDQVEDYLQRGRM